MLTTAGIGASAICLDSRDTESSSRHSGGWKSIMRQRIIQYIRAGYPGLYLVSPEEQRVEAEFKDIAKEIGFRLHVWSATTGLLDVASKSVRDCNDPLAVLLAVPELPKESIIRLILPVL